MRRGPKIGGIFLFVSVLFMFELGTPSAQVAEKEKAVPKLHPYITVEEEYTNNLDLTPKNKKDDFITKVYPGLNFSATKKTYGLDLDYRLGLIFYAKEHERNYVSHLGNLNAWYALSPRLTFRARDYLVRSEDPREREYSVNALENQYLLSTIHRKEVYLRNVFEPSMQYQFGRENMFVLNYRNNYYHNSSPLSQDSQENFIDPQLTYWFNIRNGVNLEYGLTLGHFENSPDLLGHMGRGRYMHRFNPKTTVFGEYIYMTRDFDEASSLNYDVHAPSLGIEHKFSPTLTGRAQVGYFWEIPEIGSNWGGPFYNMALIQQVRRTTYTLLFQGGYTEDFFTAQNLGFVKYNRGIATISHQLMERLRVGLSGSLERVKFRNGERDWISGIWGTTSYQLLRWLVLGLEVGHRENHSNVDTSDYSEYRAMFRATATY